MNKHYYLKLSFKFGRRISRILNIDEERDTVEPSVPKISWLNSNMILKGWQYQDSLSPNDIDPDRTNDPCNFRLRQRLNKYRMFRIMKRKLLGK